MPTISADIDFEVICDECGTGLCSSTRVRGNTLYVSPCPKCIAQKDYEIDELKEEINSLKNEIDRLNMEINNSQTTETK